MEYRMLPRAQTVVVGWLAPAECVCWDCAGASLETGRFEGQALSSGPGARTVWTCAAEKLIACGVFWQSCVRLVIVCRGSLWRDSAECCATVCERCDQWRCRQVCLCATGKTVLGVQSRMSTVSGELCWETYVGSFYIATTILVYIWFRAMKHIFSKFYQFRVVLSFQIIGSPPAQSINRLVLQMRVPLEPLVVNQQGSYDNCARCYMLLFF